MKRTSIFLKQREISWSWVSVFFIDVQYSFLKIGFCEWKFIGQDLQKQFCLPGDLTACKFRLFKVLCTAPATRGSSAWLVATGVIVWWWQTETERKRNSDKEKSLGLRLWGSRDLNVCPPSSVHAQGHIFKQPVLETLLEPWCVPSQLGPKFSLSITLQVLA